MPQEQLTDLTRALGQRRPSGTNQLGDSRVTLTKPPADASSPYILETQYGKIDLRTANPNTLAVLAEQINPNNVAAMLHYRNRTRHTPRHEASGPSTAEQTEKYNQLTQLASRLSQLMTRLGFDEQLKVKTWEKVIKKPSLLPGQVQVLETQATRNRK